MFSFNHKYVLRLDDFQSTNESLNQQIKQLREWFIITMSYLFKKY